MNDSYSEIIHRHCRPLEPVPTGVELRLAELPGIRAVLFDVYGTLLISASGDVGTVAARQPADAFVDALDALGVSGDFDAAEGHAVFVEQIEQFHAAARRRGVEYPEVEIRDVWSRTLTELSARGWDLPPVSSIDVARLAVEFECRVNPVWPMPGAADCLQALRDAGLPLGIVSNAQFFTSPLFPVLLDAELSALGFNKDLVVLSYRVGESKPAAGIFRPVVEALTQRCIEPAEALYVGNDMLNDVAGASEQGFCTALFAGDRRSLRLRENDPRVESITPDLVLTELAQLPSCLNVNE